MPCRFKVGINTSRSLLVIPFEKKEYFLEMTLNWKIIVYVKVSYGPSGQAKFLFTGQTLCQRNIELLKLNHILSFFPDLFIVEFFGNAIPFICPMISPSSNSKEIGIVVLESLDHYGYGWQNISDSYSNHEFPFSIISMSSKKNLFHLDHCSKWNKFI